MQDVQTLSRFLLPPGRVTTCTVWTLGSHRRLVRRWECDTDLPKPGPFPQISHTAAIVQTPQTVRGSRTQLGSGRAGTARGEPGPTRIPTDMGNTKTADGERPALSPLLARLNGPVQPGRRRSAAARGRTCRHRDTLAPTGRSALGCSEGGGSPGHL